MSSGEICSIKSSPNNEKEYQNREPAAGNDSATDSADRE
jgi:hypothetical protein